MGYRDPGLSERLRREREMVRILAVMAGVIFIVLLQFLLLMVAVDGALGAGGSRVLPTALASAACFGAVCWLIRAVAARPTGDSR